MGTTFEGSPSGAGMRIAIAVSRFNELVTNPMLEGAKRGLTRHGVAESDIDVAWVPGSFELPLVAKRLAAGDRYDAVICIGAVIRGETAHFEHVAGAATSGILRASLDAGKPVIFEVLTVDTLDQALARAGGHVGNKGYEAATSAIEMVNLLKSLG